MVLPQGLLRFRVYEGSLTSIRSGIEIGCTELYIYLELRFAASMKLIEILEKSCSVYIITHWRSVDFHLG